MRNEMDAADYNALRAKSRSKYGNVKTVVDGITFDSAAEARRYGELRLMEQAGAIDHLETQSRFPLTVNGSDAGAYVADFCYRRAATDEVVVEDVKSPATRTPLYRLKRKLVKAIYGVEITEVDA